MDIACGDGPEWALRAMMYLKSVRCATDGVDPEWALHAVVTAAGV